MLTYEHLIVECPFCKATKDQCKFVTSRGYIPFTGIECQKCHFYIGNYGYPTNQYLIDKWKKLPVRVEEKNEHGHKIKILFYNDDSTTIAIDKLKNHLLM